jgi:hypothetical protein
VCSIAGYEHHAHLAVPTTLLVLHLAEELACEHRVLQPGVAGKPVHTCGASKVQSLQCRIR